MSSPVNGNNFQTLVYLINKMTDGGGCYSFTLQDAITELNSTTEIITPMLTEAISLGILTEVNCIDHNEYQMTMTQVVKAQSLLIQWILELILGA